MEKKQSKTFSLGRTSKASFIPSHDVSSSTEIPKYKKKSPLDTKKTKSSTSDDNKSGKESQTAVTEISIDSKASSTANDPANKILYKPKRAYERPSQTIPFHIPHKKLLEKIEHKKELPQPLSGYRQTQAKMLSRKLPRISTTLLGQGDTPFEQYEPPKKMLKIPEHSPKPFLLEHLPRRTRPSNIVNQDLLIAKVQSNPDYSFFYMIYAVDKSSEFYNPYALKIVQYEQIDKHCFITMSTKGVTQYYDDEMTYTPIETWKHEYELYCRMNDIKLFRLFREWKAFFIWRKSILFRKFHSAANYLEKNLYILIPKLRDALLSVQAMCVKLESANFMNIKVYENFFLYYFVDAQYTQIDYVKTKILEYQSVSTEIINTALHDELLAQGFTVDDRNLKLPQSMVPSSNRKTKDTEVKMSYIEQARKKRICVRLSCFLELIDLLTIHMIHLLVKNSFIDFEHILKIHMDFLPTEEQLKEVEIDAVYTTGRSIEPLFIYDALMNQELLYFDPTKELTNDAFVKIISYWDEVISLLKPLLSNSLFDPFVSPLICNKREDRLIGYGPSLQLVLDDDKEISILHEKIFVYFETCWRCIEIYVNRFEPIRTFYIEDVAMDREQLELETNLHTFKSLLQRYNREIEDIGNIVSQQDIGIFRLKLNLVKEIAYPQPVNLIAVINTALPVIGNRKIQKIMDDVVQANLYIEREPTNTKEYVALLDYIDKLTMKIDFLESDLDYAKDLYDITDEYQIAIDNEDVEAYLNCGQYINGLRTNCDKVLESKEKIIDKLGGCITNDFADLMNEVTNYKAEITQPWLIDARSDGKKVLDTLTRLKDALDECQTKVQAYKAVQKTYRLEVTRFDILDQALGDVKLRILLWDTLQSWNESCEYWYSCEFSKLNLEEINDCTLKNIKNVNALERGLPRNEIVPNLKTSVELMKDKLPVVQYLRNPSLRPRHWMIIENILKHKFKPDEVITLQLLETLHCFNYPDQLMEIAGQASSEYSLEAMLKKVEDNWKAIEFTVLPYKDTKDVFILGSTEEVQVLLDESMITVNTVAASRNVGPIKPRVDEWVQKLDLFSNTMDEWLSVQQQWMYLEVIFSAPDIQRQLPAESKMFQTVDKSWKEIMRRTFKIPLAMQAAITPGVLEMFQTCNNLLDQIMKCLEAYLEVKRVSFPRFYFLSNDELLEILAQTRNPHAVQPHLRKCFDAIAKLQFGSKIIEPEETDQASDDAEEKLANEPKTILTNDIVAMISPEGEIVDLGKGLKARGNVEDWLGRVEDAMFVMLRRKMKGAIQDYIDQGTEEWLNCHPNQIVLTVSQIMWATDVHTIFDSDGDKLALMADFMNKNVLGLNALAEFVRGDLNPIVRKIIIALITIDVHARDTISLLVNNRVQSSEDFEWLKMIRYYWDKEIDNCLARMSNSSYIYGYEYLGVSGVLVITPLTDRCYLCLMGALQLDLGGAPAGPAGTGKTETTKDLAKSLAIQCVVFNCSEGLDYRMMGRFFSGLAQSGAWCCFDEFNRIDIEVLSVIAQQLITIKNAKTAGLKRFMFEGREIKLVRSCAAFITMNPGYAGRTELPDNLKALFRPISMMVPDYALIAEVTLYSEGFVSSKILAKKMTQMYKLCSEQLSQQDHYDFGMRAVKSVLVMAGSLKRANPDKNEDVVLIRALKDSNLPKFLADDALLFKGILGDLFPGIVLPDPDYGLFQDAIVHIQVTRGLQPEACQINKVIQLHETMIVRWGVMLVGPTGGGKTTVLNVLGDSLSKMYDDGIPSPYFQPVHCFIINPKAVAIGELYGEVNLLTLEWRDGLLGIGVRQAVNAGTEDHQWIVCDGPVDAVWIENLNTVLDDNKMLCLANSERIKLTPYVHMVFEVQDLSQASPATVSRCGMVYIDPGELRWLPYVKSWIARLEIAILNDEMKLFLINIFESYVDPSFEFIVRNCEHAIHQVDISKVSMLCKLIESIFMMPGLERGTEKSIVMTYIAQAFVFSLLWSLGGNLTANTRNKFESFLREKLFLEFEDASLPVVASLWQIFLNNISQKMDNWAVLTPEFTYDSTIPFFDMLVPTIDTVRFGYIMERLLAVNASVMFTGDTGVGKSVIAKSVLNKIQADGYWIPVVFNFSAQTSSLRTQEMFEIKLEKKRKTVLGAPIGKKIVVFVDDVNMPKLETYGAQPPIELLRQYLDFGGLYDRKKLFWKKIVDVIITCACAPPGGGRNPLTPRFVRHFGMLCIPAPNESSMKVIFSAIIRGFFDDFSKDVQEIADPIVNSAVEVYLRIETDLLPTPDKSHYVFNLRDLSKCIQGILQADSGTMREQMLIKRLFYHECLRVFGDRLINMEDKSYFYHLLEEICRKYLEGPVLELPDQKILEETPMLLFGDFLVTTVAKEERLYEEIVSMDKLQSCLTEYLEDYNLSAPKPMHLNFFQDALEHTTIIARILRAERGNALLVGVGGMGKQSLTRLASHVNMCKVIQIELSRNYDHSSFFDDLRGMYFIAGVKNTSITFIFTDTQILQEEFLEDVNNILNSGDVPNLFAGDEYEKVMTGILEPAKKLGISGSRDAMYDFFIGRVRANLHLALCMSPVGDAFRRRCRMFPSLVNCCTIDWFTKWPAAALLSVSSDNLKGVTTDEEVLAKLSGICVSIHESVENMTIRFFVEMRRYFYTTPSSYLELLKLYRKMIAEKYDEIVQCRERIANGLKKLYETNSVVDSMKAELIAMEPSLKAKNKAVSELVEYVSKQQSEADKVRVVVLQDETAAKIKAASCQELADEAQKDLDKAMPAMRAAAHALGALNKSDINELKAFQKPPAMVKWVLEPVCILLGSKTDWDSAKKQMGDNFLKRLVEFDKNNIPEKILKKLIPYLTDKNFDPDVVAAVSKVCKSMVMWVKAIDSYAKVYKDVGPKIIKQQEAEKELKQVMSLLKAKQKMLADVESKIAELQEQYRRTLGELQELQDMMNITAGRLNRAGRLTSALGDEQGRWEKAVENYGIQLTNLVGDILIAAASVAYLGAFTLGYRTELVTNWLKILKSLEIPSSDTFNLITVLADAYEIRVWNTCSLPSDSVSVENAIFVTRAGRWPLMIDPQEQANRWIRSLEMANGLKITKLTDPNFMRILESSIRIGVPVLLEEVGETLDPTLAPILAKQITLTGGRLMMRLGDTDIEYDKNFKFYITTKLPNPHYMPEICIQVTLVNFTVTPSGLEEQLLGDVVRLERPDLEQLRTECIVRINEDKNQLTNIEDKILKLLFASKGNILDDEELINTLNESKETSAVIASRLIEAENTELSISIAREKYRTVATRGSILFFVVSQLSEIDPMYQYSLKYFNNLFNNTIDVSEKNPDLPTRLQILYREITLAVYTNISRGLFEKHKLVFSFLLCVHILINANEISESKWNYLIHGPVGAKATKKKPDVSTLTDRIWTSVLYLEESFEKVFQGLENDCLSNITLNIGTYTQMVSVIYDNDKLPEKNWDNDLEAFEKLMLVKCLKEEKLVFCITSFVKLKLGQAFVESPQVTLNLLYQDITNTTPLIFVLSTGSDPFAAFQRFAAEMDCTEKIQSISLGQGQGPVAERLIEKGRLKGDWIFLQNCHLATSWMLSMERLILKLSERGTKVHADFRLYLSSMPLKLFPVSVLQNSVKVTNEPPKGLRSNIKRAFSELTEDDFENHPLGSDWRKIIFGIVVFQAIIQERKKFGPLGWNIIYEFTDSDRECAFLNFKMFCASGYIPWDALEYITGEITYGGRVTDSWDQRCLKTILKIFFSKPTLVPGYKYSPSGIYYCPEDPTLEAFREYIDNLPLIEEPEIFGMHENANVAYQTKETSEIIDTILASQPRTGGTSEGKSSNEIVADLANMIEKTIIPKISFDEVFPPMFERDSEGRLPSLTTVLTQEIDRFNKLLKLIHSSLAMLKKAIKGFVVMSEELEGMYVAILHNQVPELWAKKAYPSLKTLGSWITDLQLRLDFVYRWLLVGMPPSIWLSGFFFPQGFLTGCLQTHARKYNLPIDSLIFDFTMTSIYIDQEAIKLFNDKEGRDAIAEIFTKLPEIIDGAIVHGVFIDAARFCTERMELVDPYPGEMNPPLPAMILTPCTTLPENDPRYNSPLYKTSVRAGVLSTTGHSTNFVISVLLPASEEQSYWIIRGTALLTQLTN